MEFTNGQKEAFSGLKDWWKRLYKQIYVINGYAGVGKTTIVKYFLEDIGIEPHQYRIMTLSGKASLVLTNKGTPAKTMHSEMYYLEVTDERLPSGRIVETQRFIFNPNAMDGVLLLIIDEISMVNMNLIRDALSYGIPIIVLGDRMQLPPIGEDNGLLANPDVNLTEITRQALDNPIIYLSMLARQKKWIQPGVYKDKKGVSRVAVIPAYNGINDITDRMLLNSDQIICGYNKTRKDINARARQLKGHIGNLPVIGDKMICTKNNWDMVIDKTPLINGLIGYATSEAYDIDKIERTFKIKFRPEFSDRLTGKEIKIDLQNFENFEIPLIKRSKINQFDFGDAITCHKSQGSEYDKVVLYEEVLSIEDHHRWAYTGLTRARSGLIYFQRTS
ncbi:ATP-dependent RecD-like DNA helicase [Paenibacillus pabuli]|uniref:ATP-dependent DNA helicase n=1 Tax=Paenibacillus pabuli TaxID=1472 RepID=UPI003241BAA6